MKRKHIIALVILAVVLLLLRLNPDHLTTPIQESEVLPVLAQDTIIPLVEIEKYADNIMSLYGDTSFYSAEELGEVRDSVISIVKMYRLAGNRIYDIASIEEELLLLNEKVGNNSPYGMVFAYQLTKHLKNPITVTHPFSQLEGKVLVRGSLRDNTRFFSYYFGGGSMRFYKTFLQYPQDGSIGVAEIDIWEQRLYKVHSFDYQNECYYILISYAKYNAKCWSENIRVATIKDGVLTYHTEFFPKKYFGKEEPVDVEDYPLNGCVIDECFVLYNGDSVEVESINLVYDEETHSFSFDELKPGNPSTDPVVYENERISPFTTPTGKRITMQLNL
ncbi:hypothetical protein LJC43_04595 [Parabacteroides sp. OttesenSCG-928-G21]|nr:hypothetical protein [Parabacteroides sp. OttesenSCG-928-G21]